MPACRRLRLLATAALLTCQSPAVRPGPAPLPVAPASSIRASDTLQVQGRYLLDTCGNRLVIRGVEQPLGHGLETPAWDPAVNPDGGTLEHTIDQIAQTGANAVRLLLDVGEGQPSLERYASLVDRAAGHGLVVYLSVGSSSGPRSQEDIRRAFWARDDVRSIVEKHRRWIVIDALQEPGALSRAEWRARAIAAIGYIRSLGYKTPLTVMAAQDGRDLPAILQHGLEIVASDPLRRTVLCWQAYWGSSGWYQRAYAGQFGLARPTSIADGIKVASRQAFPIQVGLDYRTDPGEVADYGSGMAAAARDRVGWLWWAFWHPFEHRGAQNGLLDVQVDPARRRPGGVLDRLNEPYGALVVRSRDEGLASAVRACGR